MRVRSLFVCLIPLAVASSAHAQAHALDQGSIQIGGSASLTSTSTEDEDRVTTISLRPHVGYFVAERLAIGADLVVGYTRRPDGGTTRTLGIGPAATFYFGGVTSTIHPYVAGRASMSQHVFRAPLITEQNGTSRSATAAAGILTMLSRGVGLTTELFYTFERREAGDFEVDTDTFGLAAGIAAFVF